MKRFIRNKDGSITLEAALVLPFFMLFIVFLATLIRISVADMALYKAASETTEVIVSFAYPVNLATTKAEDFAKDKIQSLIPDELANEVKPEDLVKWADDALLFFGVDVDQSLENLFEGLSADAVLDTVQTKFEQAAGDLFFNSDNLHVDNVELPDIVAGTGDYLEIEVSYDIPISIPFVNQTITISKTAAERVWTGS